MRAALLKLVRELRMADPDLGGDEAYFQALARMAHTQAVIYEALNRDVVGILFSRLCNPVEPRVAVAFGIATPCLQELTKELREQLKADHEAAAALYTPSCLYMHALVPIGTTAPLQRAARTYVRQRSSSSCVSLHERALSAAEFATLGKLGSVLPALLRFARERHTHTAQRLKHME